MFDDHGHLKVDHYDIIVSTPDGVHSVGAWNISEGLTMPPQLTSTFTPHLLVTNRTLIVGAELVSVWSLVLVQTRVYLGCKLNHGTMQMLCRHQVFF